jgi:hypothetical protein
LGVIQAQGGQPVCYVHRLYEQLFMSGFMQTWLLTRQSTSGKPRTRQDRSVKSDSSPSTYSSPPGFGGFARTLLAGLGVPVENRFGLRPAVTADGSPAPVEIDHSLDVLGLLRGVENRRHANYQ